MKKVNKVSRPTKVSKPTRPTKPTRVSKPLKRKATKKNNDIKETIKALRGFAQISMLKDIETQKGLNFCYKAIDGLASVIVGIQKQLTEIEKKISR